MSERRRIDSEGLALRKKLGLMNTVLSRRFGMGAAKLLRHVIILVWCRTCQKRRALCTAIAVILCSW